jgi:hypothetical protein
MSRAFDIADLIKARLEANSGLDSVSVVVDRQKSLASELAKITGKIHGALIITWDGGTRVGTDGPLVFTNRYVLDIWTKPIIRKDQTPSDDMVETVIKSIDGWNPVTGGHCDYDARVTSTEPFQNEVYLIHRINIEIRIKIP